MSSGDLPSTCKDTYLESSSDIASEMFRCLMKHLVSGIQGRKKTSCHLLVVGGYNHRDRSTYSTPSGGPVPTRASVTVELLLQSALSKNSWGKSWFRRKKLEKTFCEKKQTICWYLMYFCLWYLWIATDHEGTLFLHLLLVRSAMPQVELASRQKKRIGKMGEVTWCYIFCTAMWYYDIMNTHIHLLTLDFNHSWYVVRLYLL